jgi:uncharacterized protein (DUF2141 family)
VKLPCKVNCAFLFKKTKQIKGAMSESDYKIVSTGDVLWTQQHDGITYTIREVKNRTGETWFAVYIDNQFYGQFPAESAAKHSIKSMIQYTQKK